MTSSPRSRFLVANGGLTIIVVAAAAVGAAVGSGHDGSAFLSERSSTVSRFGLGSATSAAWPLLGSQASHPPVDPGERFAIYVAPLRQDLMTGAGPFDAEVQAREQDRDQD